MNQGTTFLLVMTGLMLSFWIFGILPSNSTANSTILATLANPQNMQTGAFVASLLAYVVVGGASALILGFFVKNTEWAIMAPIGTYLLSLMWDFIIVYQKVSEANPIIALLVFSPLLLLWILTVFDYIRGRD